MVLPHTFVEYDNVSVTMPPKKKRAANRGGNSGGPKKKVAKTQPAKTQPGGITSAQMSKLTKDIAESIMSKVDDRIEKALNKETTDMEQVTGSIVNDLLGDEGLHSYVNGQTGKSFEQTEDDSIVISDNIPEKVKSQIWSNKFIDLALLLPNQKEQSFDVGIVRGEDGQGRLTCVAKEGRVIRNIETWTKCFHIYIAVYSLKQENWKQISPLLTYMTLIRDLARKNAN